MLKRILFAFFAVLVASANAQLRPLTSASGNITTQNLVSGGACTADSCIVIDTVGIGQLSVQVTGTYTGALSAQVSNDGAAWVTLSASTTFTNAAGTQTATIGSGVAGVFTANVSARKFRITGLAAMTGAAVVTIQPSDAGGGGGGSSGGGGGAITAAAASYSAGAGVDGWDLTQGAQADAACASSGSTCSVISILKALLVANVQLPTSSTVASGTLTNVAASATSVTCLASNAARLRGIIYNDSTSATLYIKAGTTASTSSFTWLLLPGASLVLDSFPVYTGKLDCIWSAAVGNARVTEF